MIKTWFNWTIFMLVLPDYPHKRFNDTRTGYCLLMEALAMRGVH